MEKLISNTIDYKGILYRNLIILYVLNISDLIFTKFLLYKAPELFFEANVFLKPIIHGVVPYFIKIFIMAVVLVYWYLRSKGDNIKQMKRSILVSRISIIFYGLINILHLINLGIYFSL